MDNVELVRRVVADASRLPGIVVDDVDAELVGQWQYPRTHRHTSAADTCTTSAKGRGPSRPGSTPTIHRAGTYEVRLSHCTNVRRADNVRVKIHHADGESVVVVNEQKVPEHAELFTTLGRYRFQAGRSGSVEISNEGPMASM